jgi:LAO/AO transport system kinase
MMKSSFNPVAIRQGDRLALSRALSAVENDMPASREIMEALFPHAGKAHLVGITGATGTGKSTLVNQVAKTLRMPNTGELPRIAIIAVDPTSPFTGGALLGDRIRMNDLSGDQGIFIRSMASRGALGGLAHNTAAFATVLDAAGFDLILIETVGAGQAEVEIAELAHTVIVVEAPGLGDDIQAIKAGILEIADILVVNKSDRPGAENTALALQSMLSLADGNLRSQVSGKHMRQLLSKKTRENAPAMPGWKIPVLQVTATQGDGVVGLIEKIHDHKEYLLSSGLWQVKEANRLRRDLEAIIKDLLVQKWERKVDSKQFETALSEVTQRELTPLKAAELLVN